MARGRRGAQKALLIRQVVLGRTGTVQRVFWTLCVSSTEAHSFLGRSHIESRS